MKYVKRPRIGDIIENIRGDVFEVSAINEELTFLTYKDKLFKIRNKLVMGTLSTGELKYSRRGRTIDVICLDDVSPTIGEFDVTKL